MWSLYHVDTHIVTCVDISFFLTCWYRLFNIWSFSHVETDITGNNMHRLFKFINFKDITYDNVFQAWYSGSYVDTLNEGCYFILTKTWFTSVFKFNISYYNFHAKMQEKQMCYLILERVNIYLNLTKGTKSHDMNTPLCFHSNWISLNFQKGPRFGTDRVKKGGSYMCHKVSAYF